MAEGGIVLDASAALALVLSVAAGPEVHALVTEVITAGQCIHVPSLFWYEAGNGLVAAGRRGRVSEDAVRAALRDLRDLPFAVDDGGDAGSAERTFNLSVRHGLTFYDAAYLELALRSRLRLKSLDSHLRALGSQYTFIL